MGNIPAGSSASLSLRCGKALDTLQNLPQLLYSVLYQGSGKKTQAHLSIYRGGVELHAVLELNGGLPVCVPGPLRRNQTFLYFRKVAGVRSSRSIENRRYLAVCAIEAGLKPLLAFFDAAFRIRRIVIADRPSIGS